MCACVCYLGRDPVKVLPQHSAHVLAGVRGHLVLQQEGELAALSDAVEVAIQLVVLTACGENSANISRDKNQNHVRQKKRFIEKYIFHKIPLEAVNVYSYFWRNVCEDNKKKHAKNVQNKSYTTDFCVLDSALGQMKLALSIISPPFSRKDTRGP